MGDEADALNDIYDDGMDEEPWDEDRLAEEASETRDEMKRLYVRASEARHGSQILCPGCGKRITKRSYQHKFCRSTGRGNCKDRYWNCVDHTRSIKAGGARLW